ncbi:GSK3-beta interaction protein-like [Hetaerina americana]|uniref:GSK3-beta interaction protein-like n=1 Tax=Hetaerina americana TaxID=62018 RepID=UPI003A7F43AA
MNDVKEEVIFDEEQWRKEAAAVIQDVRSHVKEIAVSEVLRGSDKEIYFNLTTLEEERFCIQLTCGGFKIVSKEHDVVQEIGISNFETPYSLLDSVSPKFRESFGNELMSKLLVLQKDVKEQ